MMASQWNFRYRKHRSYLARAVRREKKWLLDNGYFREDRRERIREFKEERLTNVILVSAWRDANRERRQGSHVHLKYKNGVDKNKEVCFSQWCPNLTAEAVGAYGIAAGPRPMIRAGGREPA